MMILSISAHSWDSEVRVDVGLNLGTSPPIVQIQLCEVARFAMLLSSY